MKKILLTILQYIIFFGLGALLIWWQYSKLTPNDKSEIFSAFGEVEHRLWLLIPVFIVGFLSHFFRALRWKLLLEPVNLKPSTVNITFAVLIGYLVNLLVPRMGEVARCSVLAKYEREPVDKIVGTIVAERSFDLVCLILITMLTFLLQVETAGEYVHEQMARLAIRGSTVVLVLAGLAAFLVLGIFFYRKNKDSRMGKFISGILAGILSIKYMRRKGLFLLYTALIWASYLSLVYIGFKAIEATEDLGWPAALSALVFGSLGMIATPGGIGAYPPAVQLVLVKLYHIKGSYALAYGWVSWMAQTAIVLILGLLSLLLLPVYNNLKSHGQKTMDTE